MFFLSTSTKRNKIEKSIPRNQRLEYRFQINKKLFLFYESSTIPCSKLPLEKTEEIEILLSRSFNRAGQGDKQESKDRITFPINLKSKELQKHYVGKYEKLPLIRQTNASNISIKSPPPLSLSENLLSSCILSTQLI